MRNPAPVGGTWNSVTFELRLTFDERIDVAATLASELLLNGTPLTIYHNVGLGSPDGRVVSWATAADAGEPFGPLIVDYVPGPGAIRGVGGGDVLAFNNFGLTLL